MLLTISGSVGPLPTAPSRFKRSRESPSMISCASEKNSSRALSPMSGMGSAVLRRFARQQAIDGGNQELGAQGLGQISVGPQEKPARSVLLGGLGGDDEHRGGSMAVALPDELNQLEAIDVRHVDVGNDQVVGPAGQHTQRIETAGCFDDVDGPGGAAAFQSRANERPRRRRVLHHHDSSHGLKASLAEPRALA